MGRKARNKISKRDNEENTKEKELEQQQDEIYKEEQEDIIAENKQKDYYDILWGTRMKMIQYCDNQSLPICDYLTQNNIQDFIDFLQKY